MSEKVLRAKYGSDKTPLKFGELEIGCYVLNNGMRVLSGRGIQKALGSPSSSGAWLSRFVNNGPLASDFSAGENNIAERINNPIKFMRNDAGGSQSATNGYEATLLIDICSAIIDANRAGVYNDENIVRCADTIIRSVAKVGIIALIDEATGYQHEREKDELQKILSAYISEELLPWQKRFPDVFYQELFRLNGWDYTVKGIKKRPGIIGKWTNKLIYEQLPPGVLDELKRVTPKSARLHQSLTVDIGQPELAAQITQVVTVFRLSDNMAQVWSHISKLRSRQAGQLELPFEFDEDGHTKPDAD